MLYFKEIYCRLIYLLISFLISLFILYNYKEEFVFILILPSWLSNVPIEYFIFTEPKEIFLFYVSSFIFVSLLFNFPLLIFSIKDYIQSALYTYEKTKLDFIIKYLINIYMLSNIIIFFICIPLFWNFFSSFDQNTTLILFFLELSAINYFKFLFSVFIMSNVLIILLLILLKIFLNNGITFILEIKKYIYLIFIIFSTVITPPELELQIFIFVFLCLSLEFFIFVNLLKIVYKKKL
jgi:sec-independent protein translocase protein TatC